MVRFMGIKAIKRKLRQDQIAKEIGCLGSTLQRYRNDINVLSPYKIPPNTHKRRQKITNTNLKDKSNREHDVQRRKMTSIDLIRPQMASNDVAKPKTNTKSTCKRASNKRNKNILESGSVHENFEINDEYWMKFFVLINFMWN